MSVKNLNFSEIALLGIASTFAPLGVLINPVGIVHPERLVVVMGVVWGLAVLAAVGLIQAGASKASATFSVFVVVVLLMTGGALVRSFDSPLLGWLALLAVGVLAVWLISRLHREVLVKALIWGVAIALLTGSVFRIVEEISERGEEVPFASAIPDVTLSETPDIFLVVLDGYSGLLARELDGMPQGVVLNGLTDLDYKVPDSAWSPYWITSLAVPAMLEMGYPVESPEFDGWITDRRLYESVAGENAFMEVLSRNGYRTYVAESGWTGSSCGPNVDDCVQSSFVDEAMYWVIRDTVLGPLFGDFGSPWTASAVRTMDWLENSAAQISSSATPEFVYAHVVAPHPPFYLDPACDIDTSFDRAGLSFQRLEVSADVRHDFLLEQLACIDSFVVDLASTIQPDDVVVFVGDHGTDRRHQANSEVVDWSEEAIVERMNVFVAANLPRGCELPESINTSNLLRLVLGCLSEDPVELNDPRIFINPMQELEPNIVSGLMETHP